MTVAGMFVILSEAQPIGNVLDYFYRVDSNSEACLFWANDAPEHGFSSNEEVVLLFIYIYISCKIPSEQEHPALNEIITHCAATYQKASKIL